MNTETCFVCDIKLDKTNRTNEHVFPKWLLNMFELHNQGVCLLNHTSIPYKSLTIPCCVHCNSKYLSSLEKNAKRVIDSNMLDIQEHDRHNLMIWVAKIFYGILYKETLLSIDRSSPENKKIVEPRHIENFSFFKSVVRSIRSKSNFTIKASIFLFDIQVSEKLPWYFHDDTINRCIGMKIGTKGVLIAFDSGAQELQFQDFYCRYKDQNLRHEEFMELMAYFFYIASLFDKKDINYLETRNAEGEITNLLSPGSLSTKPLFRQDWDNNRLQKFLAYFLKPPTINN